MKCYIIECCKAFFTNDYLDFLICIVLTTYKPTVTLSSQLPPWLSKQQYQL